MNPLVSEALGSVIRWALTGLFGLLVAKGIWTESQAAVYLTAAVGGVLTLGWSLWAKYSSRLKLVTALASPRPMSELEVERVVSANLAPPVALPKERVPYLVNAPKSVPYYDPAVRAEPAGPHDN